MSEKTTKKRETKTKGQLLEKMEDNNIEKFKEAITAAEKKFGYTMEPAMYYSKMGAFPQIEITKKADEPKEDKVV